MKRAFSIIELLVTCAILAIVTGLGVGAYRNLSQNASTVAQNQEQKAFQSALEVFHITGGNLATILNFPLSATSSHVQAAALTIVLRNPANTNSRIRYGNVSNLISSDMIVVPYSDNDGCVRLVPNASNTILAPQTSGTGFAIVPVKSSLGIEEQTLQNTL
jgi:prepilin-type N-terminal cleavage/methylation domain-containing protein